MARPRTISDQTDEPVDPHGTLEILTIEIVLTVPERQPEERLQILAIEVHCSRIRSARDALQDQEAMTILDQPFRARFTALEERPKYVPPICTGLKPKIGN